MDECAILKNRTEEPGQWYSGGMVGETHEYSFGCVESVICPWEVHRRGP